MNESISEELFRITADQRIPVTVNYEITSECNLNCIHCFRKGLAPAGRELNLSEIEQLFSMLHQAAVMFLTITGGEPMRRPDIYDIFALTRKYGFSVILFTNGTMIDKPAAEYIKDAGFFAVHISLFSDNSAVHDSITGLEGSWKKASDAAIMLRRLGVNTVIKCPVMKNNIASLERLKKWCGERELTLKADPFVSACEKNSAGCISDLRLDLSAIVRIMGNPEYFDVSDFRPRNQLECPAGVNSAAIRSDGQIMPCIIWRIPCGNIIEEEFSNIWERISPDYGSLDGCRNCANLSCCGVCPGVAEAEGIDVFCKMASSVRKFVKNAENVTKVIER